MEDLSDQALTEVAAYFQVLSEPTRLRILNLLRAGERKVGDIAKLCGFTAANVSRHLAMLANQGVVARENRGTSVFYRIADPSIYALCDLVCGNLARQLEERAALQRVPRASPPPRPARVTKAGHVKAGSKPVAKTTAR